jgi:Phage integrase, N-terminal SAM-like domain
MSGTRRKPGRMGPFVAGFRTSLSEKGYSDLTVRNMLKDVGAVGRWMQEHDLQVSQLTPAVIAEFCSDYLAAGNRCGRVSFAGRRFNVAHRILLTGIASQAASLARNRRGTVPRFTDCSVAGSRNGQRATDKDSSDEVTGEATSAFPRAEFLNEPDALPTVGRDSTVSGVDKLPTGSALLVVKRGPNAGSRFLLDQPVTSAGRHPYPEEIPSLLRSAAF